MLKPAEYLQDDMDRALDAGSEPDDIDDSFDAEREAEERQTWVAHQEYDPPATESRFASDGYYRRKIGYDQSRADEGDLCF